MLAVHSLSRRLFAVALDPLDRLPPLVGLVGVSAVSGVLLIFVFRWSSNPAAIRAARRQAQAHLLAVRLYRDDLAVVFRAQARFLGALGRYLGHMAVPFAVMSVPFALLFAQLDARYGSRALYPGERVIVEAIVSRVDDWALKAADGVEVEAGPVRIAERGEIDWRIVAKSPGRWQIALSGGDRTIEKEVRVSVDIAGAPVRRMASSVSSLFLAPAEPAIDDGSGVHTIEIDYPTLPLAFFGYRTSWIVVFLIVSAGVAFALRRTLGVEF
jgi:hypothetical protein